MNEEDVRMIRMRSHIDGGSLGFSILSIGQASRLLFSVKLTHKKKIN
jgi:hypothetical protein